MRNNNDDTKHLETIRQFHQCRLRMEKKKRILGDSTNITKTTVKHTSLQIKDNNKENRKHSSISKVVQQTIPAQPKQKPTQTQTMLFKSHCQILQSELILQQVVIFQQYFTTTSKSVQLQLGILSEPENDIQLPTLPILPVVQVQQESKPNQIDKINENNQQKNQNDEQSINKSMLRKMEPLNCINMVDLSTFTTHPKSRNSRNIIENVTSKLNLNQKEQINGVYTLFL